MSVLHPRMASSALQRAKSLLTSEFTYELPQSSIATAPLPNRSSSKLLVVPRDRQVMHANFSQLPELIPDNSLLIVNSSRVIPARLHMFKPSGGKAELLLLNHISETTAQAMCSSFHGQHWRVLVGGKNIRVGHELSLSADGQSDVIARVIDRDQNRATVRFECASQPETLLLTQFLDQQGKPPLPPYMRRRSQPEDRLNYQTVYASEHGSVAAPTAGLHITDQLLEDMKKRGIRTREIVLHIGIGTFQQLETPIAGTHDMHEESLSVSGHAVAEVLSQIRKGAPVVAVGTTSVRTMESLYWYGVRLLREPHSRLSRSLSVGQWEPYEAMDTPYGLSLPPTEEALSAVLDWIGGPTSSLHGRTKLLIVPGYQFKTIDALITNFHQPRSTLLMLVSAFYGGESSKLISVYELALRHNYRFLSYGDSSIYAEPDFFAQGVL